MMTRNGVAVESAFRPAGHDGGDGDVVSDGADGVAVVAAAGLSSPSTDVAAVEARQVAQL